MDESPRITARAACLFLLASYAEPLRLEFLERGVRHLGAGARLIDRVDVDTALSGLILDGLVARESGRGRATRFAFASGAPLRVRAGALDAGLARGWRADAPEHDSLHWELQLDAESKRGTWDTGAQARVSRRMAALLLAFRLGDAARYAGERDRLLAAEDASGFAGERERRGVLADLDVLYVLDRNGEQRVGASLPPAFRPALGPAALLLAFARGVPLRDRLAEWADAVAQNGPGTRAFETVLLAQALAAWCGDTALLGRIGTIASRAAGRDDALRGLFADVDAAARALLAGDGAASAAWIADNRAGVLLPRTALRLPGLLLAMLAELGRASVPGGRSPLARAAEDIDRACGLSAVEPLAETAKRLCTGAFDIAENRIQCYGGSCAAAPWALLAAFRSVLSDPERCDTSFDSRAAAIAGAVAALDAGLPLPAANVAGALRWIPALAARADAVLARAAAAGVSPLLRTEAPPPPWTAALDDLEKLLAPPAADEGGDGERPNRFEWRLFAKGVPGHPGFYAVHSFTVLWQKRLKSGGWSEGRTYKRHDLEVHPARVGTLPPADEAVRAALLAIRGWTRFTYGPFRPDAASPTQAAVFAALAGNPNATLATLEPEGKRRSPFLPVALETAAPRLLAVRAPDGSLRIEPEIAPNTADTAEGRPFLLRKIARGRFAVLLPDAAWNAALEVLRRHAGGAGGAALVVPPEGAARASRILSAASLAGRIALAGDLAAEADPAALPRLAGDPTPVARLAWRGSSLELALRVRPAPGRGLLLPPGEGAAERTVLPEDGAAPGSDEARPARLVRDLDEERRRAVPALAALEPFADARAEGSLFWRFEDDLEALGALDALHGLGEQVVRLEWRDGSPAPSVVNVAGSRLTAGEGADHWFSVAGEIDFDDGEVVSFLDLLRRLPERGGRYVRLDEGRYLRLTDALRKRLEAFAGGVEKGGALRLAPAALLSVAEAFAESPDGRAESPDGRAPSRPEGGSGAAEAPAIALPPALAARASQLRALLAAPVPPPPGLRAVLRPYQLEGYAWLSRLARCGLGACLADDMGLGKTVQLIALLLERAADGPSLVVAPVSVVGNWAAELRRFAPTLRPVLASESAAFFSHAESAEAADEVGGARSTSAPNLQPGTFEPGTVVLASYGLLVSRPEPFEAVSWNILALDEAQAVKNHATLRAKAVRRLRAAVRVAATGTPVENRLSEFWSLFDFLDPGLLGPHDAFLRRFVGEGGRATPALKRIAGPLVLRRLKGDVLRDLPRKTEIVLRVPLGPAEASAYEACRRRAVEALEGASRPEDRMRILAELTRLRRFCCHPSLVVPDFPAAAKLDAFLELAEQLREGGHRALVFSQFTDFLAIVRERLAEADVDHLYLDGATPARERTRLVDAFQRGEGGDLFLISLKAGGTGLNLTAADYVVLLDPWWNPAVENQAADRAHRIGQTRPVTVYRLVAAGTVEEKVLALHDSKRALAEDLLSATGSAALTPAELLGLFRR